VHAPEVMRWESNCTSSIRHRPLYTRRSVRFANPLESLSWTSYMFGASRATSLS
jgi:hypothetical protein